MGNDLLESCLSGMLLIGFAAFGIGTLVWIIRLLLRFDSPPEFYFLVIGSLFVLLSVSFSRMLSRA